MTAEPAARPLGFDRRAVLIGLVLSAFTIVSSCGSSTFAGAKAMGRAELRLETLEAKADKVEGLAAQVHAIDERTKLTQEMVRELYRAELGR